MATAEEVNARAREIMAQDLPEYYNPEVKDDEQLDLWASSIWAQVSVYALADRKWHDSFRPEGLDNRAWAAKVRDHICDGIFASTAGEKLTL